MATPLTRAERTILANLNLILAKLNEEDEHSSKEFLLKAEAFKSGHQYWYDDFLAQEDEYSEEDAKETSGILHMFTAIESTINQLPTAELGEFTDQELKDLTFVGFDGNKDDHYLIMKYFFKQDSFKEFESRQINSHSTITIGYYRKMLSLYNTFEMGHVITTTDLKNLLAARFK